MNNEQTDHVYSKQQSVITHTPVQLLDGSGLIQKYIAGLKRSNSEDHRAGLLFITSYPPRECGIATYTHDLISTINKKFSESFAIKVCALESGITQNVYPPEVVAVLNTLSAEAYTRLSHEVNNDPLIQLIVIQHEFGFFNTQKAAFLNFLSSLTKPVVIVFHTVLPNPAADLKSEVNSIAQNCRSIVVMTRHSADILVKAYGIPEQLISIIAHGTHLVAHTDKKSLKKKYGLADRKVLTTFGLLSSGKSIETTLDALPAIIGECPEVVFLIMGMTHPEVKRNDGEAYRDMLMAKVKELGIDEHVIFINRYLPLSELLDYLQLTDIYLFTTNDPNQAVSGTFAYAMSCACPIISTPIPHALEVLTNDTGIIIDFHNSKQLANSVIKLLKNNKLRKKISSNTLIKIMATAWENSAIAHAVLFEQLTNSSIGLQYNLPEISLNHLNRMTTITGIIQFSRLHQPAIDSGYTLDDNARALIAFSSYYQLTGQKNLLAAITKYLNFIQFCIQPDGRFLNYVDKNATFTEQNYSTNLDDSNGRAIWALGYVVSLTGILPEPTTAKARLLFKKSVNNAASIQSTRAMSFIIKGIFYYNQTENDPDNVLIAELYADRLVQMYRHEASAGWEWYEGYLTYANSVIPEALLNAWQMTGKQVYKDIAIHSLDFLMTKILNKTWMELISNKTWLQRGEESDAFGEQPIDVAYTVMTLYAFYKALSAEHYREKMMVAFNWFLGHNRLHQTMYNPCTGSCYDGLEETGINLNQGAESSVSYLLARLVMEVAKRESAKDVIERLYPFSSDKIQHLSLKMLC